MKTHRRYFEVLADSGDAIRAAWQAIFDLFVAFGRDRK
jgi:hypothetical protein